MIHENSNKFQICELTCIAPCTEFSFPARHATIISNSSIHSSTDAIEEIV